MLQVDGSGDPPGPVPPPLSPAPPPTPAFPRSPGERVCWAECRTGPAGFREDSRLGALPALRDLKDDPMAGLVFPWGPFVSTKSAFGRNTVELASVSCHLQRTLGPAD